MADKEIGELLQADPLDGTELVHVVQGGNSRKTEVAEFIAWLLDVYEAADGDILIYDGSAERFINMPYPGGTAAALDADTDGTLAANSDARIATQKAVKTYVDAIVTGLLDLKGSTDCSANPNYPAASKGDAYVVSVAGKIGGASGMNVDVGDVFFAKADNAGGTQAAVGANWTILEHNLAGALLAANNLSDLASPSTALDNLGFSADAKSLIAAVNYAAMRTLLGLGTAALLDFDTDDTLAADSDDLIATQAAVKSFVEGLIAGLGTGSGVDIDTDGTLAANSDAKVATQKATKTYVDNAVTGLLDFKGGQDCSANPNYPAALKGDAYVVTVAGKIGGASGITVAVGDVYFANADNVGGTQAGVGTSWQVLEHNLVGALLSANNLSDLTSVSTALDNLGFTADAKTFIALANYAAMRTALGAAIAGAATASGLTMATARLLGRTTASSGAIEEIAVGAGLSFASGTLKLASYIIPFQIIATPTVSELLLLHAAGDAFTIPANFSGALQSVVLTNPTASFALDVQRALAASPTSFSSIGTITVSTGGVVSATTVGGTSKSIAAGDVIKIVAPTPVDATAANMTFSIVGAR